MRKQRQIKIIGIAMAVVLLLTGTIGWARTTPDNSAYAALLSSHVNNGFVNYKGLKQDEKLLQRYLDQLSMIDPEPLPRHDRMAFYINVYNAWTIKLILDNYPGVASIKELGSLFRSPWKKKFVKLNGATVSLDHIEHAILRPLFKDPRIHFAINCAAKSCPPLLAEPYAGNKLERQLNRAAKDFVNDPVNNYMKGDTLYISSIFKWFSEDFGEAVADYVKLYARGDLAKQLNAQPAPKIKYVTYDWSLNGM